MVDSAERAAELRDALSEPAVPDDIESWQVIDRPDRKTVMAALGDADIDVAYCELPIEGDRVLADDGAVALNDLDGAPVITVFEGTKQWTLGAQSVSNGGLLGVMFESTIGPAEFRRFVWLLTAGTPPNASVSLSIPDARSSVRTVGDSSVECVSNDRSAMIINSLRSISPTAHRVKHISPLSFSVRMGTQQHILIDEFEEHRQLTGVEQAHKETLSSSQVQNLLDEPDGIVCLNGELIFPTDGITEAWITESADRALAEATTTDCIPLDGGSTCVGPSRLNTDCSPDE